MRSDQVPGPVSTENSAREAAPVDRASPSRARRALAALAAGCLVTLAVACSGSPPHPARPSAGAGAAATRLPSPVAMRGALNPATASTAYSAAIVPAYPVALKVADALIYHPAAASAQVKSFRSGLAKAMASLGAVTAFPGVAGPAFAAYRAQARSLLALLGSPAAIATQATRHRTALTIYALARQIGELGTALNLVPATEPGGRH